MPHACSPCFCPYTTENASIFGKNRSPRSICQSRTHTTTPWTGSKRNREIFAFFTKSRSLDPGHLWELSPGWSTTNRQKSRADVKISYIFTGPGEPKPGNRRFSPKSVVLTKFGRPMRSALTDQPKINKNKNTRIDAMQFKSPPGSRQ